MMPWIAKFIGDPKQLDGLADDLVQNVYYAVKGYIPSNNPKNKSIDITIHNLGQVIRRSELWCRTYFKKPVWITDVEVSSLVRECMEASKSTDAMNGTQLLNKMVNLKLIERFG